MPTYILIQPLNLMLVQHVNGENIKTTVILLSHLKYEHFRNMAKQIVSTWKF